MSEQKPHPIKVWEQKMSTSLGTPTAWYYVDGSLGEKPWMHHTIQDSTLVHRWVNHNDVKRAVNVEMWSHPHGHTVWIVTIKRFLDKGFDSAIVVTTPPPISSLQDAIAMRSPLLRDAMCAAVSVLGYSLLIDHFWAGGSEHHD